MSNFSGESRNRGFSGGLFRKLAMRVAMLALPLALAGCNAGNLAGSGIFPGGVYASVQDSRYTVPAIDTSKFDRRFLRRTVNFRTRERPGTIIVDTQQRFLYLVQPGGKAIRYGIGVGKQGFAWGGTARVAMKRKWPTWTPTKNMIRRDPKLVKYAGGMPPGINNPLGARAHYLYRGGRDTNYRIHGTNEPWSIGKAVSSGCIRMLNQDVIDLYNRVPVGAKVIVRHRPGRATRVARR